ncbi:hypothetical protein IGI04_035894 [Brassica rapa subsp. trilocularis]|uniref:Uncharacterized protein n=1 Tax=Brassica rapa subsp. trilocularis TaxID=1813537 RepID=A0ABQ7LCU6_BRACM|nr:hypothetical protein IGI04_035894 [Brassica rapa subsp. trilocularis]
MSWNSGKHGLSLLRSSGDSIRKFDENAWIDVCRCSEEFNRYTATELRLELGRYVATERDERSIATGTIARSLRSDRAGRSLGRYVATELWLEHDRYVATDWDDRSLGHYVATELGRARSLHSDQAGRSIGRYVATELFARARSLRSDRTGRALGRYIATEVGRARSLRRNRVG